MAFLRQLQLLLWKNGLGTIRRPVWSITLILWPIIIFIIIAVTRHQFPPVLRQTCYVGPRNLPSTGFFPFLETLLCNSDSNCQNTSQSAHPHRNKRSTEESPDFPLSKIIGELRQFANLENTDHDPAVLLNVLSGNFGASSPGLSLGALNETLFGDHPIANSNKSAGRLKSAFCTIAFLFINNTSTTDAGPVIAFCTSNNTVFEVTINTLYKAVRELVMTQQIRPEDLGKLAENILELFDQLQKEPSLWEFLHVLPQIVNPTSPDQLLGNLKKLFESLQLFLNIIEHKFPEVKANMSSVHPFIEAGVSLTDYMRNWPGKNVKIRLGDVMTSNDSLCQMMGNMEISLDQALALYFDTKMVSDYVCQITYNPVLMAACATGTVEKCLSSTSTNKLLQQTLLKWSTLVAPHDLSLAKGLLHSLMELFGGSRMSRATRSLEEQAQNVEEELFLGVGKVVREILQISPEATAVVNQILQAGFQSMTFATKAMAVLEGGMDSLLKDVTRIKMIVQVLSTDQPQSTSWMIQAFNSVSEMIAKIFAGESLTCDNVLSEFEWLFSIKTIRRELWQSFFCENTTTIEQTLLSDWTPLIENALALYHTLSGHSSYNVTLPMILSEWHGLWNRSERVVQLSQEWGGANWTSWVPANSSSHLLLASLQNSVAVFLGKLGQKIVHEWPEAKSYMYMTDWILHYEPGVTASPNCSMDVATFAIECHGNLNWEKFVNALLRAVMSPNEDLLISCLKGSVQLLQHVYSNFFKYEAASFLHREVEGGHMIAVYLSNMLNQLNEFVFSLTKLPDDANPQHIIPLFQKLLESTGLKPLLPLILSDSPVNISQVLKVASELGRSNQAMFTFNESDPTMAELEKLITQFLSMEGNLSMSLYLGMSNSLLTYSSHFSPEYVAKIKEAIQPFTNQTSSGVVEAILSAVELLEIITDSSNSEPTHVILGYLRLLQDFVASLFQVKMLEQVRLANGQLSPAMVTQLPILSDMLNFITPEGIMNLTRVGPVAAQQIIIQKYIQTLPPQLRQPAIEFLHDFVDLQTQLVDCESVEDCLSGTSEVLEFVDNILGITLDANGNASINIAGTKTFMGRKEYTPVASALIPLLLKQNDAAHVRSAKEISKLTSILINLQNITVRDVQDALSQTNLTIEELNDFVEQLGALDVNDLLKKINKLLSASKCFEQLTSPALVTQCVGDMVYSVHSFLMHFPAFQNETSILSMIPVIVNKTLQDIMNSNFNRHPQNVIAETLNTALSNVKMALQQNNMSSSEIMNELDVLQRVINLIADPELMKILNISMDEFSTGRAPLEIILWCLNRLENVTSISSTSQLLNPIFRVAQMQVALALAQVDLNQYIQQKITNLTENLQYPINEGGVGQIANATIEIMQHMMTFLVFNLETQNAPSYIFDYDAPINMTCVNATVLQINSLLKMLHQANIGSWINPNRTSRTVNDISNLLQATIHMFNIDTQGYIIAIGNITQALTKAVMFSEQPNGLQNDKFLEAILEAIRSATQLLIHQGVPVPLESVQDVARNIAWLIVYPEQSYALTLNTTLNTIHGIRSIIQVLPPEVSFYLHIPLRIADAYFQSVKTASGPDGLNELILNIMFEVQSLLPPNDTAQFYVGTIINITKSILQPSPGNSSLLPMDSTEEIMSYIMTKLLEVWNMLCPVVVGESCSPPSSTQGFADLPMVLEELINGQTNNVTWMKLHNVVDTAMTFIVVPELSNNISCLVEMFEKSASEEVREMEALTDLILSLQTPFMKILTEITRSLNGSHFNMSEVSERLEQAVEQTIIMALEKSNGTHNCQEVLKIWDPVREAAGLRPSVMTMWCNISLLSVIEAFGDQSALTNGTCTEMGAMSSRTVAARIVMSIRSLYDSDVAQSEAMEQFTEEFESLLSALVSHPLSQTAKYNLNIQLQALATHNSLQFIELFSDEVDEMFPFLKPYMKGMRKMLKHILTNSSSVEESPAEFFKESSMILLHQFNISSKDFNQIMTGNFSDKAWVDLVIRALQAMINMKVFGDDPMLYHTLDQLLTFNDTREIMWKLADMVSWFTSTEAKGQVLLIQTLTKFQEFIGPLLSVLNMMDIDLPPNLQLIDDLTYNANLFIQNLFRADLLSLSDPFEMRDHALSNHNASRIRRRREVSFVPVSSPMDDFMTLFTMDYRSLWTGLQVPPTASEIQETFLMFFDNSDLSFILKEATKEYDSDLDGISSSEIVDSMLNLAKIFLENDFASLSLWVRAISALPDGHSSISVMKDVAHAIDAESPEIQRLMQETLETVSALFLSDPTELQALQLLQRLEEQVCDLERTNAIGLLEQSFSVEPGVLCQSIVPGVKILVEGLLFNMTSLVHNMAEVFVGDPSLYNLQINWTSMISEILGFNISALGALNMTNSAPVVTVGEMVRNRTAFMRDLQTFGFAPEVADQLSNSTLPDNLQILWWLVNLAGCNSSAQSAVTESEKSMFETFCRLGPEQLYNFTLLMVQHLNTEQFLYRMVLPEEVQRVMGTMTQVALYVMDMVRKLGPNLETWFSSLETFSLSANNEFRQMSRSQRKTISSKATFVTISRALCRNGIVALFAATKNPHFSVSPPPFENIHQRQEMIERFKIPHDATPFCTNMYLDMVNTTGGAIAWAFLKPMLMGKILFTPDTPQTRAVITKANSTLQQFADLKHYSQDWIKSSEYISKSTTILTQTLPLLQNSLSNAFVKNFIEMQTGVSVDSMQETLNNFSNVTVMLEKNKDLVGQINALSTLMVDISSCITFDRYQGYDSEEELNREAQDLAKDRALYASVIFKLPKGSDSRKRRSVSSSTPLPPRMHYTIRMHMDNVMRTDRVRNPFFSKETHISARQTLRYNRGFIYLQESIDRAIIEIQANKTVTDTAVQIQPFPYPCHKRDEFLEAISFVFPLLLMIAWVLFVADFVKKLVHEREMKLHEYMKMMGVNPLSHFFAWFLESAFHLVITIFFLTLVLKYGDILPKSDGFLLFLYLCDYGLSILAFSFLVSTFFDQTYIASLSGSLLYVLSFFPFIVVMAMETHFSFSVKSLLGLFSPTAFSYASQYVSRYEAQGEGIQWSNSYSSPIAGDTASFGWLCWLMLIDTFLYLIIAAYIRTVFPGQSGIPSPWYFPFTASFWKSLCGCKKSKGAGRGLFLTNIMQTQLPAFPDSDENGKDKGDLSSKRGENFSDLPVGVALHGLTKIYGRQAAIENLNVAFYEGHVTSLLGHNGAGKTTTMSILTGLFPPSSGSVEVYGRDMQANLAEVRTELGVCMQYDVLFDHMTAKEHLLLYGQIKAPHWTKGELKEQVRTILEETDMYAHRHKRVGTLSGGMKRKLSISIAFIGGSRLVVLDEPTTGVDPCSRRSIWDVVIKHKKGRTIIMSTHHLDEAEVLSDRIAFLERGGLKCCGSPFYLKEQLGQGYKLTLTKKMQAGESEQIDNAELKAFVQAHVPAARLKEAQGSDLVYLLPPFSSNNASSYRSLLTALDSNLDALQLGGYGISDTTLEEVFLHLTHDSLDSDALCTVSETVSDTESINSYPDSEESSYGDTAGFTGTPTVSGVKLAWQQFTAILIKRFHHSRRDWKGLIAQLLLPVLFVAFAMGLGSIRSDLKHYPSLELSPALYSIGPSYSFFSDRKSKLADALMSFPGLDNTCLENSNDHICPRSTGAWSGENGTKPFSTCKCVQEKEVCGSSGYVPPHKQLSSSQIVYNLTDLDVENYIVATSNDFIRNRYGGFDFGLPLPSNLRMDVNTVPENRTLSKVWFNPEGHHTMPAYLNSINNLLLRSNLPEDKDPSQYSISVSSHPYFGRPDDEDSIVQGMLQIMVALCILAGYSITTASFAIYEVSELHSGSKRLQHIAGVSEPFYWAVNFFYDMVVYMIPVVLTVGVIAAFQVPAFNERQNLGAVTLLLVLFGFSTFPWMYLLSSVFKTAEMAFISYVCINLFLSVNTIIPTSILFFMRQITQQNAEGMKLLFDRLSNAFLIFPQFNFGNGLLELARMNIEVQLLSGYGIDAYKNPFSTEALGWMMIASFIQGLFFFALRLLWNKTIVRKVRSLIVKGRTVPLPWVDEDEDVAAEHLRVSSGAASADVLQVNQLTKVYQHLNKKVPAVKKLSLGVPAGECFGLLGVNGAGKTTTFKMLTGDVSPTEGTAQIRDRDGRLVDIMECRNQGVNIGYCPQVDALDGLMSGEEHLYFYARLHGISKRDTPGVVNYLLRRLELDRYRDTVCDSYSCGTRRKLSTALALVGHPQILLLDEPSSGMDPRTKRHLWKIITAEVKGKCAVVLTSHSMEECEALCGRLAVMVQGQFRCLGSLQHIKNRFGSGFTVRMYLAKASCDAEAITRFMQSRFPSTYLKDQHSAMVEYHVPVAPGGVADIFGQLESSKEHLEIQHFSVSQTTLDEVFINFAMGKIGMETVHMEEDDEFGDDYSLKGVDA
ncbi:unnamed protein product [Knipowitschia caucasica]